jgi:hypothetical protein
MRAIRECFDIVELWNASSTQVLTMSRFKTVNAYMHSRMGGAVPSAISDEMIQQCIRSASKCRFRFGLRHAEDVRQIAQSIIHHVSEFNSPER